MLSYLLKSKKLQDSTFYLFSYLPAGQAPTIFTCPKQLLLARKSKEKINVKRGSAIRKTKKSFKLQSFSISNSCGSTIEITGLHSKVFRRLYHARFPIQSPSIIMLVLSRRQQQSHSFSHCVLFICKYPIRKMFRINSWHYVMAYNSTSQVF